MLLISASYGQSFPVDTLLNNGTKSNRINLVFLSDGYHSTELDSFIVKAKATSGYFFMESPFDQYEKFFNVFAIKVPSSQSGATHYGNGSDEPFPLQPISYKNTSFGSRFDYGGIHRLLVATNSSSLYSVLSSNFPDYDIPVILVNSPYYGGSGGEFPTASTHISSPEICIHEIGHSFAGLADEYWAAGYQAEKPNMTTNGNPATIKWKNWLNTNNIGIYAYGNTFQSSIWFKPSISCKMELLGNPFCSVCKERFIDKIHQTVSMIDAYSPASNAFSISSMDDITFKVSSIKTIPNTVSINWYLNNNPLPFATGVDSVSIPNVSFIGGNNIVKAEVIDNTSLSKSYLPGLGYVNSVTWNVSRSVLSSRLENFSGKINNNQYGVLDWSTTSVNEVKSFDLERSTDGNSFVKVASIQPEVSKNSYRYNDNLEIHDKIFYRITVNNIDGSRYTSGIVLLSTPFNKFNYKVYQNPSVRSYKLSCTLSKQSSIATEITNMNGQVVSKKNHGKATENFVYAFNLSNVAAGNYLLNIYIDNVKYTAKLIAE